MTEIPQHLLDRAREARERAEQADGGVVDDKMGAVGSAAVSSIRDYQRSAMANHARALFLEHGHSPESVGRNTEGMLRTFRKLNAADLDSGLEAGSSGDTETGIKLKGAEASVWDVGDRVVSKKGSAGTVVGFAPDGNPIVKYEGGAEAYTKEENLEFDEKAEFEQWPWYSEGLREEDVEYIDNINDAFQLALGLDPETATYEEIHEAMAKWQAEKGATDEQVKAFWSSLEWLPKEDPGALELQPGSIGDIEVEVSPSRLDDRIKNWINSRGGFEGDEDRFWELIRSGGFISVKDEPKGGNPSPPLDSTGVSEAGLSAREALSKHKDLLRGGAKVVGPSLVNMGAGMAFNVGDASNLKATLASWGALRGLNYFKRAEKAVGARMGAFCRVVGGAAIGLFGAETLTKDWTDKNNWYSLMAGGVVGAISAFRDRSAREAEVKDNAERLVRVAEEERAALRSAGVLTPIGGDGGRAKRRAKIESQLEGGGPERGSDDDTAKLMGEPTLTPVGEITANEAKESWREHWDGLTDEGRRRAVSMGVVNPDGSPRTARWGMRRG